MILSLAGLAVFLTLILPARVEAQVRPDDYAIIDMHGHALPIDYYGPTPQRICLPMTSIPMRDVNSAPGSYYGEVLNAPCPYSVNSPSTEDDLRNQTLAVLKRRNILSLMSGPSETLETWRAAAPENVLPLPSGSMS